jgi:hypothetical protein
MHWAFGSIIIPCPLPMGMGLCYNQLRKLEFDEQLSYAPNLAMFSDRAYIDNNKERR